MNDDIKSLQEKVKITELNAKLKKLGVTEKKETTAPKVKSTSNKYVNELKELESKRAELQKGKGFKNFVAKANVNYEINQRRKILSTETQAEKADMQIKLLRKQTELAKAQAELKNARKANEVNFNPFTSGNKAIKFEDLM